MLPNWELNEAMRLVGREKIQCLARTDELAHKWTCAWVAELSTANWKDPKDVSQQFPNARQSESGHFIFPIGNCNKEIFLKIAFQQGIALITGLREDRNYGS